jgi:hypothetical protein
MSASSSFESIGIDGLRAFFVAYGAATVTGESVTAFMALPVLVIADSGTVPIASTRELATAVRAAAENYHQRGITTAHPVIGAIEQLSAEIVSIDITWEYTDSDGRLLDRDAYRYLLRIRPDEGPRIQVIIARATD